MEPKVGIYCRVGSKKQLGDYENVDMDLRDYIYIKIEAREEKYKKELQRDLLTSNNILNKADNTKSDGFKVEPIISPEEFLKVQEVLKNKKK